MEREAVVGRQGRRSPRQAGSGGQQPAPEHADPEHYSHHNRRAELVAIAYRHIAQRGFEGLRVRDVALEAGINVATLHYYFPTKEALIRGVVTMLQRDFTVPRVQEPIPETATAIDELRIEFEDIRVRLEESPESFLVLAELLIRSLRNVEIQRMLVWLHDEWRGHLLGMLRRGVEQGVLRPDLDLDATATAVMAQLKGIGLQSIGATDTAPIDALVAEVVAQVEGWVRR